MSAVELFRNAYAGTGLRGLLIDGAPWFVTADALSLLDLNRSSIASLDADEKGVHTLDTPGGAQQVSILSESGLYSLILRSRKPEAKAIKRWVTHEVLPQIRRTGQYSLAPAVPQSREERLALAVVEAHQMLAEKDGQIAALAPKAEFFDALMEADGTYQFLAVSKMLGWGRTTMMAELRKLGVLQSNNLPYRRYEHHFKVVPQTYVNRKTGETVATATAYVRPSGIAFLRKKLDQAAAEVVPV